MSAKTTLQTQLKIETQRMNMFQHIFTGKVTEIPKSNISGIPTIKSPNKTSDITSKNRKFLETHSIESQSTKDVVEYVNLRAVLQFYARTPQQLHPAYTTLTGHHQPLSSLYIHTNMVDRGVVGVLGNGIVGITDRVLGVGLRECNMVVKSVNKMLCNILTKHDSICIPYQSYGRLWGNGSRDSIYYRSGVLETLLFGNFFGGDFSRKDECLQLARFLRTFKEKDGIDSNVTRYSKSNGYHKLSDDCKALFRSEYLVTKDDKIVTGYFMTFDFKLMAGLMLELLYFTLSQDKENTFMVTKSEFLSMSSMSQTLLLDRLSAIDVNVMYIKLYEKNEVGRHGRRYSTLDSIPRFDRKKIELYGYDMESALQRIQYSNLNDKLDLTWTKYYIDNKKAVRVQLAKEFNIHEDEVKKEITAIYQGRHYDTKKFPIHADFKKLFDEVKEIREYLYNNFYKKPKGDDEQKYKYARKRVKEKYPNGTSLRKLQTSFMFFVWTYDERRIQDVMCKYIKDPLPLHDAVYSQCDELPDMQWLEEQILIETGIDMLLGIA